MIFNANGFPKPTGASDWMDSAHLSGMMAFVMHPLMSPTLLAKYCAYDTNYSDPQVQLRRCPYDTSGLNPNNYKNCTRDQLIPYLAGLNTYNYKFNVVLLLVAAEERNYRAQNVEKDVPGSIKKWPDGADWLDPSHRGYIKLCTGLKANWFERFWMLTKIVVNGIFTPMSEPNNIIVMSVVYRYAKFLKRTNPKIDAAIREYWSGWRQEPELAEMIINKLNAEVAREALKEIE